MTITATIIRSFALTHTAEQLREKLLAAQEALAKGSVITNVTSGAGTGYARTITLHPAEAVELYQRALDLRESGDLTAAPGGTQVQTFTERSVC